ncbi:glycine cleavage system aminomethyltransferase GcvT [Bacillaceae bacterium W0354]
MGELKQTPIYPVYSDYGAKTIDFGGWDLPVQFSGIKEEHHATRTHAGLFDVSHMGEIIVSGPDSEKFLQKMLTNDVSKLEIGKIQYTIMCYENGGSVDDFLVYKMQDDKFLLVVNAANTEKDYEWLKEHEEGDISIENISSSMAQLALQGPNSEKILQRLTDENLNDIKMFRFKDDVKLEGLTHGALISRTGYTGEDGFEIYLNKVDGITLWKSLLEVGKDDGIVPVGLGARDTLRFEATLALYGQELSESISPIEAGLGFAVNVKKEADFIGKDVLKDQKLNGPKRKLVGIEMIDKGIPRHGYDVLKDGDVIGTVTSGTQSPTLEKNLGLALIKSEYANEGETIDVQVRKRVLKAQIVSTPFYKRKK